MKKIIFSIFALFALCASMACAGEVDYSIYHYDVGSATVTIRDYNPVRKGMWFLNEDSVHDVRISTQAISSTTYANFGSYRIKAGGEFKDDYFVYKSTWFSCSTFTVTGSSPILTILEKE